MTSPAGGRVDRCSNCGSAELTWAPHLLNKSGVADGRLRMHDVSCSFVLGCDECSETVRVVDADDVAALLTAAESERDAALAECNYMSTQRDATLESLANVSAQRDALAAGVRALAERMAAAPERPSGTHWATQLRALLAGDGEHNTGEMK